MAKPWTLRSGSQFPIRSVNEAPQAKAVGDLSTATISVGPDDLLSTHRHAHKTLTGTGALALVLAALALTYLLVTCMRHLSKGLTLSSQQSRALASDFSGENEGACQEPAGDGEQETETAYTEGSEPEGAGAAPLRADPGAHGPAPAASTGEARRRLPAAVQSTVGRTLRLLEQPAAFVTTLIPNLRPDHCLALVRNLCKLIALELSAFATVPTCLQPLRQRVAQVYSDLIEQVMTTEATSGEAVRLGWNYQLRYLQLLLQRLALVPPETEKISVRRYELMMENQQRPCHWVISQVLNVLQLIKYIKTQDPTPRSNEAVFKQRGVLNALFLTRRQQILNSATLRYWLEYHQPHFEVPLIYDSAALNQARLAPPEHFKQGLQALSAAVIGAGGTPTARLAPLPPMPLEQQQHQQQQPLLQQFKHHPHPIHLPLAPAPARLQSAPPRGRHPHSLAQALSQAPYMPRPPHPAHLAGLAQGASMRFAPPRARHPHPRSQAIFQAPYLPQPPQPAPLAGQAPGALMGLAAPRARHPHPFGKPHSPPQNMPHLPQAAAQPPGPFDSAQQDLQFPAVNPHPQLSRQPQAPTRTLQIQLPDIYQRRHPFTPPLGERLTSSSAHASSEGGLVASFAHSQPSGSAGQPPTPQAGSLQTATDTHQDSFPEEDDS